MHIFCATRIGGYMFLQRCSSGGGGGHKIFDHQIGGHKNIANTFGNSWPPPHSKENGGPLSEKALRVRTANMGSKISLLVYEWPPGMTPYKMQNLV